MPKILCVIKAITAVINKKHTVVSKSPCPTAPRSDKMRKSNPLLNSTTISARVVKICPASPKDSGLTTFSTGPNTMPKIISGNTSGRRVFSNREEKICPKNKSTPINKMA